MSEYLIWSNEHRQWWKPGECGYTRFMAEAGLYTRERAIAICSRAQDGRGLMSMEQPPEIPVRLEDARECLRW